MPQGDQLGGSRVNLGQAHRGFVGLGAAGGEHALLQAPGGDARHAFGELYNRQGRVKGGHMADAIELRLDG